MNSCNIIIVTKEAKIIERPYQYCEICQKRDALLHSITECERFREHSEKLVPQVIYFVEFVCNLNEEKIGKFVTFLALNMETKNKWELKEVLIH